MSPVLANEAELYFERGGPIHRLVQRLFLNWGVQLSVGHRIVGFLIITWVPLLLILGTWAVSYPLWAEGRYSLPAQPFVAIGVAVMLIRLLGPLPRAVPSRAGTPPHARSRA